MNRRGFEAGRGLQVGRGWRTDSGERIGVEEGVARASRLSFGSARLGDVECA